MSKRKIAALVPMRHHSQRVPEKNFRPVAGRPLYQYILQALLDCSEISQVVVDTDSPVIMDGIREYFPEIVIIERPEHLRQDTIPMNEILLFDAQQVEADLYLQTHSTNPLLKSETISRAINLLHKNFPAYDSMFSVTRIHSRFWDQLGRPVNHNPDILLQTQDLPPIFEENSCFYIFSRTTLEARRNRLGYRPFMFEVSPEEAWDIDEESDLKFVDMILKSRQE